MSDSQLIAVGEKLKAYFEGQSISQSQVAARLGVSQPAISALLNGKPFGKNTAKKWSDEFGIKPNWLITGEGEMLQQTDKQPQANDPTEGCACPFTESMKGILENMTSICDVNKRLVEQQSDLIAAIKELSMKR